MALLACLRCTARFSVGAESCPQCGSEEFEEDWRMPKISKGDGASYEPGYNPNGITPVEAVPEQAAAVRPEPEDATADVEPDPAPAPAPKK